MAYFYIANPSSASVAYQVNGSAILPGRPSRPPGYTPQFVFAGIAPKPTDGVVGYGTNTLQASFSDTLGPRESYTFVFIVQQGSWSIDDDLIAYVFRGLLMLMTPRGMPLPPNPPLIKAEAIPTDNPATTSAIPTPS